MNHASNYIRDAVLHWCQSITDVPAAETDIEIDISPSGGLNKATIVHRVASRRDVFCRIQVSAKTSTPPGPVVVGDGESVQFKVGDFQFARPTPTPSADPVADELRRRLCPFVGMRATMSEITEVATQFLAEQIQPGTFPNIIIEIRPANPEQREKVTPDFRTGYYSSLNGRSIEQMVFALNRNGIPHTAGATLAELKDLLFDHFYVVEPAHDKPESISVIGDVKKGSSLFLINMAARKNNGG
jgi:hypothetical protein